MFLRVIILSCILTFFSARLSAQQVHFRDTMDVSKYKLSKSLRNFCVWYKDSLDQFQEEHLEKIPFTDTIPKSVNGVTLVGKTVYLKSVIKNSGDTALKYYFLPGFFYKTIKVFEFDSLSGTTRPLPGYAEEAVGFKAIILPPHSSKEYFFKIKSIRSDNSFSPTMVPDFYRAAILLVYQKTLKYTNTITFIISGIMLMMIFYSLAVYTQNGNISFLYYSGYAFFLGLMFFCIAFIYRDPSDFAYFFEEYLDYVMHSVGTFFYLCFLIKFLDSKKLYPAIHRLLKVQQLSIVVSLVIYSWAYCCTDNFHLQSIIELTTKSFWLACTLIFVILAVRVKQTLLYFLALGHGILFLFASVSLYYLIFNPDFRLALPELFRSALIFFELGICIELVFFLTALAAKNKKDIIDRTKESERLKIKSERQELEQQLAVFSAKQEERNRISADMHDELGSGLTAIRLMSEIVKQKLKPRVLPEIERISHSANELVNKSNTLIWTMKSENDTLESLIAYIRTYALEFFENTSVECTVKIPVIVRSVELTGEKRRNIFLTVKETLNNTLKHAQAKNVQMIFEVGDELLVRISDDGVGIEFEKLRQFGSGLKNMKKRIEGIGGKYTITNNEDGGALTVIELEV